MDRHRGMQSCACTHEALPKFYLQYFLLVGDGAQADWGHDALPDTLLCPPGPGRRMKAAGRCSRLGSLAALKYAVVGLYLLVFLILVRVFILAGKG